ncbi:MAG TPA: S41 family peptidase [Solirubrobacteraceae bacterium]|jgi:carboxyl-terminal processing protease|nr:S41 family peptidase [Solirubrobacteraceae bacterium]
MSRRPRQPLVVLLAALLPVVLVAGVWLGGHPQDLPAFVREALVGDADTQVVNQALNEIQDDYYRPLRRKTLIDSSIAGMVSRLDDRFSTYLTPKEYRAYTQQSDAQFSGVGMSVQHDRRGLRVVQIYDNSPAARAGIRVSDLIVAVDGRSLAGVSETAATTLIKGRPGTQVRLTVVDRGHTELRRVTRATVTIPVVASTAREVGGRRLAQVALSTFSSGAHGELRSAVDRQLAAGAKGLVLDLRHNGGGLVEEARLVASIFIPEGTIVTTRGRTQPPMTLSATGGAIKASIPVVVLVDGDTASAAEIVAGALQDHHRGVVVGIHTFGKGVFQEVKPLPNGGALDITVGQYYTPSGRNLGGGGIKRGAGIAPNVVTADRAATPQDEALDTAFRVLAARVR